jgi:hypothetical protein
MKYIMLFTLFFVIAMSQFTSAQIPRTISYQGILTDNTGNPKPDGDYSMTFSFYETEVGGNTIWSEVKTLTANNGLFSTSLGDLTAFGVEVKFDKPYWLGIKVGDESELSPRMALTSVGYSFSSEITTNIIDGKVVKSINGLKDDITLEGGSGTTINTAGNTITISSIGAGGTGIQGVQNTNNTLDITDPNGPTATVNVKVPLNLNGSVNGSDYLLIANNSGNGHGIQGISVSGYGVVGVATQTIGQTIGVVGNTLSPDGYAVSGWNLAATGNAVGVVGRTNSPSGIGMQGFGYYGIYGSSAKGIGVYGTTSGVGQFSIYGKHNSSPSTYGALGYYNYILPVAFEYGVYGASSSEYGMAGYFVGPVGVTGNLSVTGNKTFKIDHPLDPANKYLYHSCVESPDRMNIYNGNVVTDGSGSAVVTLPDYFEGLTIDYRSQLTVLGQFAQVIIENKIQNNHFTIRTDKPNVEVSWQVTGVRNDEYAKQHPFVVEEEKEEFAKGKYLMPELFGKPKDKGIHYVKIEEPNSK